MAQEYKGEVIPHKYREERRAVWRKAEKKLTYERRLDDGQWVADYTTWDSQLRSDYFIQFYGFPTGAEGGVR